MAILPSPGSNKTKTLVDFAKEQNRIPVFAANQDTAWYRPDTISSVKWDQSFPFQFRILKLENGRYVPADEQGSVYTLPIPPEALTVSTPWAIDTTVTLGGTIEQHNGAPTRIIQLQGTMGVAFGRGAAKTPPQLSFADAVFAGTITGLNDTKSALSQLQPGNPVTNSIPAADFDDLDNQGKLTGYYQLRTLQGFLESYVELKKTLAGRNYRLAFCLWKREEVYLVSPMGAFDVRQAVPDVLGYTYSLTLKATKRISLDDGPSPVSNAFVPVQTDPNKLALFLNTVQKARIVLQSARKTIEAVGGDINAALTGTVRELGLFAKDALSVPLALTDLPSSIIKEYKNAVVAARAIGSVFDGAGDQYAAALAEFDAQVGALSAESSDDVTSNDSRDSHPANSPFDNPEDNFEVLNAIQLGSLNLPPATVSKVAAERDRVRNLTRLDFEVRRDALEAAILDYTRFLGLSDPVYERLYGLSPVAATVTPTDDDFEVLYAMNDVLIEINRLVVTNTNEPRQIVDALSTVAGLAEQSGIAFKIPRSKFAVPFPYGSSLESVSQRYLGDPLRWIEIATLNGLQAPYVDEEGFELPLLVNGNGNSVLVDDVTQLFVGQPVWVSSTAAARTKRRIRKIEKMVTNQWLVTVDGEPNLSQYGVLAQAVLFAFIPHTVNSQQTIYIPSDTEPSGKDFKTKTIAGIEMADSFTAVGGIDFLLTPKNDLVLGPHGQTRWATGLTNISQKVRLMFAVRKGMLLLHPGYGFSLQPGESIADVSASDVVRSIEGMVKSDKTFSGVQGARVQIDGPVARVGVALQIRGLDAVLPVSFEVQN